MKFLCIIILRRRFLFQVSINLGNLEKSGNSPIKSGNSPIKSGNSPLTVPKVRGKLGNFVARSFFKAI